MCEGSKDPARAAQANGESVGDLIGHAVGRHRRLDRPGAFGACSAERDEVAEPIGGAGDRLFPQVVVQLDPATATDRLIGKVHMGAAGRDPDGIADRADG